MLRIENLHVRAGNRDILRGVNLSIDIGQVHAIMGPNGSGKSTLARVLAGHPEYAVTEGTVAYRGQDLLAMDPEMRAREGVFMAFQYPVEIPGVNSTYFLNSALNEIRKYKGQPALDAYEFLALVKEKMKLLDLGQDLLRRSVNEGFSGGEKKRHEILQLMMLEPEFAVLDETDSGLDIDALKVVAEGVNKLRGRELGILIITHYERVLRYITPDYVHIMVDGKIVKSGGADLAAHLEEHGYDWITKDAAAAAKV